MIPLLYPTVVDNYNNTEYETSSLNQFMSTVVDNYLSLFQHHLSDSNLYPVFFPHYDKILTGSDMCVVKVESLATNMAHSHARKIENIAVFVAFPNTNLFPSTLFITQNSPLIESIYGLIEQVTIDDTVAASYVKEAIAIAILDQIRLVRLNKMANPTDKMGASDFFQFLLSIDQHQALLVPTEYARLSLEEDKIYAGLKSSYYPHGGNLTADLKYTSAKARRLGCCVRETLLDFSVDAPLSLNPSFFAALPEIKLKDNEDKSQYAKGNSLLKEYEDKHRIFTGLRYNMTEASSICLDIEAKLSFVDNALLETDRLLGSLNKETLKDEIDFDIVTAKKAYYDLQRLTIISDVLRFQQLKNNFKQSLSTLQNRAKEIETEFRKLKRVDFLS